MNILSAADLFMDFRKAMGFIDSSARYTPYVFARFVKETTDIDDITEKDCTNFLYRNGTEITRYWHSQYTMLNKRFEWALTRGFVRRNPMPADTPEIPQYYPAYIYSDDELKAIFEGALTVYKIRPMSNDPKCIRFILMITYFLGLRISETLRIKIKQINTKEHVVLIEDGKFHKSRYVTYNRQVSVLMNEIFEWRRNCKYPMLPESYLFINTKGLPVNLTSLQWIFSKIREKINLYIPERGKHQPRIHDLRHTFAVNVLTYWYKEGKNVQELLPKLSTFLGHQNISFTSVYLTKTPALLQEANRLFHKYVNQEYEQ